MFWKKKEQYMEWDQYSDIIQTWNTIGFAQKTRTESIKNMPAIGNASA